MKRFMGKSASIRKLSFHKTELLGLKTMEEAEMQSLMGGSFFEELGYAAGFALRSLYEMGQEGGHYQSSLSANLKK